ncbi:MAG: isoprenyl transferase [Deinococcota bacterium]|nr:isoprenyl transferase [Deinococcota bacterium]
MNPVLRHPLALPVATKALDAWHGLTRPLYWWYEKRLTAAILANGLVPKHLGLIMDGNRRFARSVGLDNASVGHDYGARKARDVLEWCLDTGITHVTMWVFSNDNLSREPQEVAHLLELFAKEATELAQDPRLHKNAVRVKLIGQIEDFPAKIQEALRNLERVTEHYRGMQVNIAVGYGGREEIAEAVRRLLREKAEAGSSLESLAAELCAEEIGKHLYTAGTPDPDFVIRTSGEVRLSGFLLWQAAYSEYYFCDAFWPAFRKVDFLRALRSFQDRERRFGR